MHLPLHVTPSPVYPRLHVQVKLPILLVQAALVWQAASSLHSSISVELLCLHVYIIYYTTAYMYIIDCISNRSRLINVSDMHMHIILTLSPLHEAPFPLYPWLQVQMKLPAVLLQAALVWHLAAPVVHSSISNELRCVIQYTKNCKTYPYI